MESDNLSQDAKDAILIEQPQYMAYMSVKHALEIVRLHLLPTANPDILNKFFEVEHYVLTSYKQGVELPSTGVINGWDDLSDQEKDKQIARWNNKAGGKGEGDEWAKLL
jgi:hypothetical protein